ncbi:shikimate kinase [Peribacillus frigoritolerans]|jgi:shikimate kinase|nr:MULTISPECIES: shikimate kinase [Peribacillus]KRF52403.1 shikimate kinase [Bacillus sp. Soil745]MBD8138914.1 shikimate kinase [Bacillus sp. CFBP 13597]MDP9743233.1 shikimate kinase [Bacillus sp. B2I3]PAW26210.1 shikimate kinase [Peribacillus simplex]PEF34308.1 shikimate kinase [Bacillus sp. AFS094228]PEO42657.1 shikimate kinase [Bacillus sp. AFS026049]PHD71068.1 shikimate kinase [Bacillus sp. AFS043905]PRS23497.1 shikimate kinase [Bacillus sp. RJGP41]QNK50030.1 shikimate kinase [Brevibac
MINKNTSLRMQSIVFIGFMGVGKTTIGQKVARKLYRDFIDIDQEIEKEFNMPTTEIFKKFGEKAFREKEKSVIESLSQQQLKIISVGGGAFLQEDIRNICLTNCIVFYLDLSWEYWKERIGLLIDSRPVLQSRSLEEIEELFYTRQEIYSYHHSKVNTNDLDVDEVADFIVDSLKVAWDIYEPLK